MIKGLIVGVIGTVAVFLLGAYLFISFGIMPANADAKPGNLEEWVARKSLRAAMRREAPKDPNPIVLTDQNLIAGIKLYAVNCAVCHGAADGKPSRVAKGLYQDPPQFAGDGVEDAPEGKLYWKVAHGIRFTGMPAYRQTLSQEQIWQAVLFLKHMNALSPSARKT
jgi:mono/diheme cytochrome c family protein